MPSIDVVNIQGKKVKTIDLNENIFSVPVNEDLIHSVVVNYLANQRQGNQSTKTRSEVRGGGRKPWRQKGTGRARHGSTRSPIWVGGGLAFAPKPRSYKYTMNKKEKRLALKQVLSQKLQDEEIIVVDKINLKEIKTKPVAEMLKALESENKTLILLPEKDDIVLKSAKNIEGVKVNEVRTTNVYELLDNNKIVMTEDTIKKLEEVYA